MTVFRARVVKPGRTLTFCEAQAYAHNDGAEKLVATMSGTLMALLPGQVRASAAGIDRSPINPVAHTRARPGKSG